MPTLEQMCDVIASKSNGKWTGARLLDWVDDAENSVASTLRISEVTAIYMALSCGGEAEEHMPLNFKPSDGRPFDVTSKKAIRAKIAEHGIDLINPFK